MEPGNIEQVKAVKAAHEKELLRKANVVGVGVGLCQRGGRLTGEACIVVSVRRKLPASQLEPADLVPPELDGVPVDVQEVGEIRAFEPGGEG